MKQQLTIAAESIKDIERAIPGSSTNPESNRSGRISAYNHAIQIIKDNVEYAEKQENPMRKWQKEFAERLKAMPIPVYIHQNDFDFGQQHEDEVLGNIFSSNKSVTDLHEENLDLHNKIMSKNMDLDIMNNKNLILKKDFLDLVSVYEKDLAYTQEKINENKNLQDTIKNLKREIYCNNSTYKIDQEFIIRLKSKRNELQHENLMLKKANKECLNRMQQQGHQLQRLQNRLDMEKKFNDREINMYAERVKELYMQLQTANKNPFTLKYVICFLLLIIFFLLSSIGFYFYKS